MNTSIKIIRKKDVPELLNQTGFWQQEFLAITKHRLFAHLKNPNCDKDDVVLLLAYFDEQLSGYMGVFIDKITIKGKTQKIGWLSTWWVHPRTKGQGFGRNILNTMYESMEGRIGVSQFTPSAKRVYVKSGYFNDLKTNKGYKFVFRSNSRIVMPLVNTKFKKFKNLFEVLDFTANLFVNPKIALQAILIKKKLNLIRVEYLNFIDKEVADFINRHNAGHLSKKNVEFFNWLKAYPWVLNAVSGINNGTDKYQFSSHARRFEHLLIAIRPADSSELTGFMVLQLKNEQLKVLFNYCDQIHKETLARLVLMHVYKLNVHELICYDELINQFIKGSRGYLYKRKKFKESIISKVFEESNFDPYIFNFGDGDCSFA